MNDPFRGYDQWKTASPYDDEPDCAKECEDVAEELMRAIAEWDTELPKPWCALIERAIATLQEAAAELE